MTYETSIVGTVDSFSTNFGKPIVVQKLTTECTLVGSEKSLYDNVTLKYSTTLFELMI